MQRSPVANLDFCKVQFWLQSASHPLASGTVVAGSVHATRRQLCRHRQSSLRGWLAGEAALNLFAFLQTLKSPRTLQALKASNPYNPWRARARRYTSESTAVRHFLEVITELDAADQRRFLRFVTGSPRLPPGGIAALQPRRAPSGGPPRTVCGPCGILWRLCASAHIEANSAA